MCFQYLFYFFLAINISFILGNFLFNFFKLKTENLFVNIFLKLVLSTFFIIIVTSIFYTKFNTLQLGLLIPMTYFLRGKTFSFSFNFTMINLKELIILNSLSLPVIFFQFLFYSRWTDWVLLPSDVNYYSEISFFMKSGFEGKYAILNDLNISNIPKRVPYHYSELWLNVFFNSLFLGSKVGYCLMFVTYPLLYSIFFIGIFGIIFFYIKNYYLVFSIALVGLFLGPLDVPFLRHIFDVGNLFDVETVIFENVGFFFNSLIYSYYGQKHSLFYVLSVLFIILILLKKQNQAIVILSLSPIINIGLLPVVFGGSLCFLLISLNNKTFFFKTTNIFYIVCTVLFIVIFYSLNGSEDIENQMKINFFNSSLNYKGEILKVFFKILFSSVFFILIFFYFFLLLFSWKKSFTNRRLLFILIFVFSCVFVGIFTRPVLEGFNSAQFLTYILPMFNVVLILYFSFIFSKSNRLKKTLFLFFFMVIGLNNFSQIYSNSKSIKPIRIKELYSGNFVRYVNHFTVSNYKIKIGYFLNDIDYNSITPNAWYGYMPCEFLLNNDCFRIYSLNYPYKEYSKKDSTLSNFSNNHLKYMAPDFRFNLKYYEKNIVGIVKRYGIKVIIAKRGTTLPSSLLKIIKKKTVDTLSGDVFIELN